MVSRANNDLNFHAYGLKFMPIVIILIFLIVSTMLNCNNDYGLKRVGLAISQKHHHNNNINIINTDKIAISSHKATTTKKMST